MDLYRCDYCNNIVKGNDAFTGTYSKTTICFKCIEFLYRAMVKVQAERIGVYHRAVAFEEYWGTDV